MLTIIIIKLLYYIIYYYYYYILMTYFGPDTCKKLVRWLVPPLGLIESALRRIVVPVFLHNKYYSCLLFSFFVITTPSPQMPNAVQ